MNLTSLPIFRSASLAAGLALALSGQTARGADKAADAFPNFDSYVKVTGQAPSVTGDPAAAARRLQLPESGAYGIEALHYTRELNNETSLEFNGRALSGTEDYLGQLKLAKNEVGGFDFGYKRFRTFYDGIGGFFPVSGYFNQLGKPELHTDRAKFWANLTVARPNAPVFAFSYSNELRNGRKDTTIWGDTDNTGVPIWSLSSLNPVSANRKLIASYIDLSERQEVFSATMKHTIGKTEVEFAIVGNRTDLLDTRWVNRYPNELKPYPAIPSNPATLVPWTKANNAIYGFDRTGNKTSAMTYEAKFETVLTDALTLHGGLSYQDVSADITGTRLMTLLLATKVGTVATIGGYTSGGRPPYSYTAAGKIDEKLTTANLGLTYKPNQDVYVGLALKGEDSKLDGNNPANYVNTLVVTSTGATTAVPVNNLANFSHYSEQTWVPELEGRYFGIKNVSLYATVDYHYTPGSENGTSTGVGPSGVNIIPSVASADDNVKLNHGNYKVGIEWKASPRVELRGELFYKDHKNKFTDVGSDTDGFVFGYQFTGTKLTAIVKPSPVLQFTTRYLHQSGKMQTTVDSGASMDSMDSRSDALGETIDWNPTNQVYVQANVNVVFAKIQTAYPVAGGVGNDVLRNATNDYVNGSLVTGFAVEKDTDAQLEYTFYHATNYHPNVPSSMAFGASAKEYTVTLGLKHKFTDRIIGRFKAGYFDCQNDTTGGFTNFRGPLGYVTIEHAL